MKVKRKNIRDRINAGDEAAIVAALSREYPPMEAVYALRAACRYGYKSEEIRRAINDLYNYDFNVFCGNMLSDFLDAANDILGFQAYKGSKRVVTNLIATKMDF